MHRPALEDQARKRPIRTSDMFIHDGIFAAWHAHLSEIGAPPFPATIPTGNDLLHTLRYLEIPEEDISDVIRLAPSHDSDPDAWWYLERAVHSLARHMEVVDRPPRFGTLQDVNDPKYRFFYVHVFVAALPHVQRYFRDRRIPDDVAQATLADLGRNVRVHRKRTGMGGLGVAWWLMLHFRGMIYQLGRLQFERARFGEPGAEDARSIGLPSSADDAVLSIHIPDFLGSMTPEECDASIARAHTFFETYFPEDPVVAGVCNSWLMDPQLRDYLRRDSNILRFQERFRLIQGGYNASESVIQFVFGPVTADLDTLPQQSSLERAVVAHLKMNKTWEGRTGWFHW